MVKKIIFSLIAITTLLFVGCDSLIKDNTEQNQTENLSDFEICVNNSGNLLGLEKNQCEINGEVYLKNSSKVINLENCASYFDGCNTCFVNDGKIGGCTLMYCQEQKEPFCKVELETVKAKIIKIENNSIDLVIGDIAQRFKYNKDSSNLKVGDNVEVKIDDANYNEKTIYQIKKLNVEVKNFESCVEAGNPVMESYPPKCSYNGKTYVKELSLSERCELNSGNWIDGANECEWISKEKCLNLGGQFAECESACRNDPDAQMCTMQCVQVCKFDIKEEPKICTKEYAPVCGIDGNTYSNQCMAGDVEIKHFGKCFSQEDKQKCEDKGGKYEQLGMMQMWQCNMPTTDAGQSCQDVDECEGTCFAQNGTGVCSDWTINFGCFSIMKDGKEQGICID